MNREPVKSSNIAAIGYDAGAQLLEIEFHPSREGRVDVWRYSPVDAALYASLVGAPSIGRRFNALKRDPALKAELVERFYRAAPKEEIPVANDAATNGQT
jgi:hypothetical protein